MTEVMDRLTFRLSEKLRDASKARAKAMGVGHHEYIRKVIADDIERVVRPSPEIFGVTD